MTIYIFYVFYFTERYKMNATKVFGSLATKDKLVCHHLLSAKNQYSVSGSIHDTMGTNITQRYLNLQFSLVTPNDTTLPPEIVYLTGTCLVSNSTIKLSSAVFDSWDADGIYDIRTSMGTLRYV